MSKCQDFCLNLQHIRIENLSIMVIQRWQSVLLLVAAVMMACFSFMSLGQVTTTDYTFNFTALGFTYEGIPTDGAPSGYALYTWFFLCVTLLGTLLSLVAITLYKNLRAQMRVVLCTILIVIASMFQCGVLGYTAIEGGSIGWSSVIIAPFVALVALISAYWCIRSDRNKLRSADRIR